MKEILVIDDEEDMRIALSEALSSSGYAVKTASDGGEGLEMIRSSSPNLIITDVRMPRMTGMNLLKEIRKSKNETPVILISAYGAVEDAVEAMKEGAFDYLLKPFSVETLEEIVGKAFKSVEGESPAASRGALKKTRQGGERTIIHQSTKMDAVFSVVDRVAASPSTILIQGESGTGKEVLARYIHHKSDRTAGPFVAVNCAALPKDLLESELFGHERGAFTGAVGKKLGKFELANGGTLLLDEVTEMDLGLQAKLLRVLQEKEIDRVGGSHPVAIDVRVVATTNRDVEESIEKGEFREDLYFRLNVIPINLPPLRERREDIVPLVEHFIEKHGSAIGKAIKEVSAEAMEVLRNSPWKGNVRELENVVERAVLLAQSDKLTAEDLLMKRTAPAEKGTGEIKAGRTVAEMEKALIFTTLDETGDNRTKAAEMLGISIRTLRNKLNEYKTEKSL